MENKEVFEWHGKKYFYLGTDEDGLKYYLEEGHFDCDWYWGFGYVVTFDNNLNPVDSEDYDFFTHFDTLFFTKNRNGYDEFKESLSNIPLTDSEVWTLVELMKSFYTARAYSDMLHTGGSNYTTNPLADMIRSEVEYNRLNKEVIPSIINEVYKLLGGEE